MNIDAIQHQIRYKKQFDWVICGKESQKSGWREAQTKIKTKEYQPRPLKNIFQTNISGNKTIKFELSKQYKKQA